MILLATQNKTGEFIFFHIAQDINEARQSKEEIESANDDEVRLFELIETN